MKTYKPIYIQRSNKNEKVAGLVFLFIIALVLACAGVASAQSANRPEGLHEANATTQPGASAVICWNIAADSKYPFFLVERTTDKVHYEIVSVVKNVGNISSTNFYSATDYNPADETTYYRVSTLDTKGKPAQHLFEVTGKTASTQVSSK